MYKIIPVKRRYTPPFYAHTDKMLCLTLLLKYFHIFVVVRLSIFGVKNARTQSLIETQAHTIITLAMYKIILVYSLLCSSIYSNAEKMLCFKILPNYFLNLVVVRLSIFGVKNARDQSDFETQTNSIEIKLIERSLID